MYKIDGQAEVGRFVSERAVITILLARSMSADFLKWFYASWGEINIITGANWHVLVPSKSGSWPDHAENASPEDFNTDLSRDIANSYGIRPSALPCLVFEDFCEEAPVLKVRIPESERDRAAFVDDIAAFISEIKDLDWTGKGWLARREVNDAIATHLRTKQIMSIGVRLLPRILGAAAKGLSSGAH